MKERPNDRFTFHPPDTSTHREVPVAGGAVEAGFPSPADDFLDAPLDLNREFVQNPASTFFVRVSGESMAGDGIGDGDLLIVDKSLPPHDGCIAVCYVDGEFTVKRVKLERGCAWLMPSNPKYRPIRVDADNEFLVWGIVRHVVKSFE
ncbi:translesion error-prone DNA polymerase V autoproteolytic subunit [uncultured Alistipes sp.]|uniref:LexA family protein n=1 Tax=uncultured Alistipes sp. TaxID=538949 RepID=UPI0025FDA187|nr:translesion error-prone DNA polymerase V autoproteolytic subunit [uncultured Alistipes sp.]